MEIRSMFVSSFGSNENKVTSSFMRQTDTNVCQKRKLLGIKWELKVVELK
jgi:hypothetical protein